MMGKKTDISALWIDNEDLPLKKFPFKRINVLWSLDNVIVKLDKKPFWCCQQTLLLLKMSLSSTFDLIEENALRKY